MCICTNIAGISSENGAMKISRVFHCSGYEWTLLCLPVGHQYSKRGMVGVFPNLRVWCSCKYILAYKRKFPQVGCLGNYDAGNVDNDDDNGRRISGSVDYINLGYLSDRLYNDNESADIAFNVQDKVFFAPDWFSNAESLDVHTIVNNLARRHRWHYAEVCLRWKCWYWWLEKVCQANSWGIRKVRLFSLKSWSRSLACEVPKTHHRQCNWWIALRRWHYLRTSQKGSNDFYYEEWARSTCFVYLCQNWWVSTSTKRGHA